MPTEFVKIGISRGVPRNYPAGYRRLRSLEPGPWFNSLTPAEYHRRYLRQLYLLDPAAILREIETMTAGRDAALLCYEPPGDPSAWCHRGIVIAWLSDPLGVQVYEYRYEHCGCGWSHPKIYEAFRR